MTSPSSIGRESECLASAILPHSRSVGPRSIRGTELHKFMNDMLTATTDEGRAEALLVVSPEWRQGAAVIDLSRAPPLDPKSGAGEVGISINTVTSITTEHGRNGEIDHDDMKKLLGPDDYGGVIDYLALLPDAVFVTDFKFGYQALDRAEVNGQLRSYGWLAARHFGKDKAIVSFCRIHDTGAVSWDIAEMDGFKIDAAEAWVRQHLKNVAEAKRLYAESGVIPPMVEGIHCTYCPAFRFCGAKKALALSVFADEEPAQIAKLPAPLDHATVSALWPKLKAAERLIAKLKDDCRDYAKLYGAVKLANGNFLGEMQGESESIDPTFARPVLEARFGREWTNYAIQTKEKLTWKGLDEVLKNHSSHGRKAKLEREVLAELEAAGAVRSITVRRTTEVSAKSAAKRLVKREDEQNELEAVNEPESEG